MGSARRLSLLCLVCLVFALVSARSYGQTYTEVTPGRAAVTASTNERGEPRHVRQRGNGHRDRRRAQEPGEVGVGTSAGDALVLRH